MQFDHPKIDWDAADLYQECERFLCHVSFVFAGPLAALKAKQKADWLGTWIGEQDREIYKTLEWADNEKDDAAKRGATESFDHLDCEYADSDD